MDIALIIPILNEAEGLKVTLPLIPVRLFSEIIIIDGQSKDDSWGIAKEWCESNYNAQIYFQYFPGLAYAVTMGAKIAKADYIVEFSPDGNCPIEYLYSIVDELRTGADLVIVSRYKGKGSEDDTLLTKFGNWMFSRVIGTTDALTMYRGYRKDCLFDPEFIRLCQGPVLEPLVTLWALKKKWKILEISGHEPKRIKGYSKMRPFYNGWCILRMIMKAKLSRYN